MNFRVRSSPGQFCGGPAICLCVPWRLRFQTPFVGNLVATAIAAAVVVFATGGSAAVQAATEVRLRSQTRCSSAVVRLGDVAEIHCDDPHLAEVLADIPLRPAPQPGSLHTVSQQELRQLLVLSGVASSALELTGSDQVVIQHAPAAGLVAPRRGLVAEGVRQAMLETTLEPDRSVQTADLRQATNVRPAPARTPPQFASPVSAAPQASDDRPLVERGAQVSVVARTAGIRVTTTGKALEAGQAGQQIQVELEDSKQRVLARVVGWQTVEVTVGGAPLPTPPLAAAGVPSPPAR